MKKMLMKCKKWLCIYKIKELKKNVKSLTKKHYMCIIYFLRPEIVIILKLLVYLSFKLILYIAINMLKKYNQVRFYLNCLIDFHNIKFL